MREFQNPNSSDDILVCDSFGIRLNSRDVQLIRGEPAVTFNPNRRFKKKYDKLFRQSPEAANLFLLLAKLADKKGEVKTSEEELAALMEARFNDYREHQL